MLVNNSNASSMDLQASKHISLGIDQGDRQWVMTAFDGLSGKKSRHCFKGATKELDCYRKVSDLSKAGKPVSVCYEAGRSGFTPARVFSSLGCECRVLPYGKLQIISSGKKAKADNMLSGTLKSLFAVAENYPQLRANENFKMLQEELSGVESKIAYARQFYNDSVMAYNTSIQTVPTNFLAGMFKFTARDFFKADGGERENVKVKF